jgi:ParB/RepB/Spo0J family partition protein
VLSPLVVYKNEDRKYVIFSGNRRLHAIRQLNSQYPDEGWGKIQCMIVSPDGENLVKLMSLEETMRQKPLTLKDRIDVCANLFDVFGDVETVAKKLSISKKLVNKYIKFARLPSSIQENLESVNGKPKIAINHVLNAVDALQWTKDNDVSDETVLELAKELGKSNVIIDTIPMISLTLGWGTFNKIKSLCEKNDMTPNTFARHLIEEELDRFGEIKEIDAYWKGHLRDNDEIVGDGYEFEGDSFAIIIVGKNKGIYKNGKKMVKKEFEKLSDGFKMSLRPIPEWE